MTPAHPLLTAARAARDRAFAPYSGFRVGAALETEHGAFITGCNVESASYGLTLCAERVAIVKAVSEGHHAGYVRIAIVTAADDPTPPCGACRQLLWEFAPDAEVILANTAGKVEKTTVRDLLPRGFDGSKIQKNS